MILSRPDWAASQEKTPEDKDALAAPFVYKDDKTILEELSKEYLELSEEIITAMIKDDTLSAYKSAAAIRVFKLRYSKDLVGRDKKEIEKLLLWRLNRTESPFVEVEIMHTLCIMDRYRYFDSMVPALIQKLEHYNSAVSDFAFSALNDIIGVGNNRTREARIVFNTLRKILFLSRMRLAAVTEPSPRLKQKLHLLRWSIKILGSQELKKLPREVISLL